MEVVSADIRGDTARIYITMQDLIGDRVDETIDLYDSYDIRLPFDGTGFCGKVGYDPNTRDRDLSHYHQDGRAEDCGKENHLFRRDVFKR